jgi:glycosyltransferase involved in cell wall biosynthesis
MISVLIPVHNEALLLGACLQSIRRAEARLGESVEIIVCLNRCDDASESIAQSFGVIICHEPEANVAKVRNRAMAAASGNIIVTLDADTRISANYLHQVKCMVEHKGYSAGAALMSIDRLNLAAVVFGLLLVLPAFLLLRFSGGMFWMTREAFDAVNGFNSAYLTGEDLEMWRQLRRYCRQEKKKFGMITRAYLLTSGRKMDEFGPWFMLTHPHWFYLAMKGQNKEFADRYLYKTRRSKKIEKEEK